LELRLVGCGPLTPALSLRERESSPEEKRESGPEKKRGSGAEGEK